ncbi:MAG TPA: DUF1080 domain-containing protein [Planctomycetota bacterium]
MMILACALALSQGVDQALLEAKTVACETNLRQLWMLQQVYTTQFGGRRKDFPKERGADFWLALTRTVPPIVDVTEMEVFTCPAALQKPKEGFTSYRGPRIDPKGAPDNAPIGCCASKAHPGIVVLLKAGDIHRVKPEEPLYKRALEETVYKADDGYRAIFDGKTLEGWSAPDPSYFSVRDGAITGETTKEHNPPYNQFIVWKGGTVKDFDLKFKFRIAGPKANSGMQFRGTVKDKGLIHGYQADIAMTGPYLGGIWDEYGSRGSLAARGQSVVIDEDGKKTVAAFGDPAEIVTGVNIQDWTDYRIVAKGSKITLEINGRKTAELDDQERGKAAAEGVLGMPIIPGEPMTVQYKDILLKDLK